MDHALPAAGDVRSPKRQAVQAPSTGGAARAVASLDDAIWTSIIEFLPIPKDLHPSEEAAYDAEVVPVVTTWHTLLNLRLVTKELAKLLHPRENASLWQRLVLQSFDFSVDTDGGFNLENYQDDHGLDEPNSDEVDTQTGGEGWTEQDPQRVAMRGRYDDMPPNYLEEALVEWTNLGIYHRPSQYGFLTTLQQQPPVGEWPASEDPFTLFGDLVRLLQLPHGEYMNGGGEGSDTTFKFLAAPAEADASSAYHRFYVMKTLGYVPHFWHWGHGIGEAWKGFTEPDAFDNAIKAQQPDHDRDDDSDDNGDDEDDRDDEDFEDDSEFEFPGCSIGNAKRLHRHLRENCRDWRSVCCNRNSDGYTPVFFVGESKWAPHRWTGYTGGKCWT